MVLGSTRVWLMHFYPVGKQARSLQNLLLRWHSGKVCPGNTKALVASGMFVSTDHDLLQTSLRRCFI